MSKQFRKFDDMIDNTVEWTCFAGHRQDSTFKQTQITISTDLRNSYQCSNVQSQN